MGTPGNAALALRGGIVPSWSERAKAHDALAAEEIGPDAVQMREHAVAGTFRVPRLQGRQDCRVFGAILPPPLLRKGALLHLEPGPLVAQRAQEIVEVLAAARCANS